MKKTTSIRRIALSSAALVCLCALSASAQDATTSTGIGAAPANSPQKQILATALSPETRQTLQEAMNSYNPAPAAKHTPSGK